MSFLYSFQATNPIFHCLYFSFLFLSLTSRSLLNHADLLRPLLDFLCWKMENSCAVRNASFKSCQICSIPLSLRTTFQEISPINYFSRLKFSFLKFRLCILPVVRFPWDHKLSQVMVNPDSLEISLLNKQICTSENQVQKYFTSYLGKSLCNGCLLFLKKNDF